MVCKKGKKCKFNHPDNVCQIFLDTEKCEDIKCEKKRHRRECKYYTSKQGCFSKDDCQYLCKKGQKENSTQCHQYKDVEEEVDSFKCEHCSVQSTRMLTLKKHTNTRHEDYGISFYIHLPPLARRFCS